MKKCIKKELLRNTSLEISVNTFPKCFVAKRKICYGSMGDRASWVRVQYCGKDQGRITAAFISLLLHFRHKVITRHGFLTMMN